MRHYGHLSQGERMDWRTVCWRVNRIHLISRSLREKQETQLSLTNRVMLAKAFCVGSHRPTVYDNSRPPIVVMSYVCSKTEACFWDTECGAMFTTTHDMNWPWTMLQIQYDSKRGSLPLSVVIMEWAYTVTYFFEYCEYHTFFIWV